jgi:tetratricopeptide (TPR) repeat protein
MVQSCCAPGIYTPVGGFTPELQTNPCGNDVWSVSYSVMIFQLCRVYATLTFVLALLPLTARAHGDVHERIQSATRAIENNPTNARLYIIRGELHREHQDYPAAHADYDHAEKLDANLAAVDLCRAKLLVDCGRLAAACAKFDEYLTQVPSDGRALIERARLLARMGQRKPAAADITHALTLLSEPQPDIFLDRAKLQVADGQPEAALHGLDDGIKVLGPIVTLQLYAIELELSRTNYDSAVTRLDTIIKQSARKESWLARRGDILVLAGKTGAARNSYQGALDAVRALPARLQESETVIELCRRVERALNNLTHAPAGAKP